MSFLSHASIIVIKTIIIPVARIAQSLASQIRNGEGMGSITALCIFFSLLNEPNQCLHLGNDRKTKAL